MLDANLSRPAASMQARAVRAISSIYFSLLNAETADIDLARRRLRFFGRLIPTASGVHTNPEVVAGLDAEWLVPDDARPEQVILYLHGGAYVLGGCDSHRHLVSHIARASGIKALLPEYSLAPENPFPAAIEDCVEVYRALLEAGYEPGNILLAGDSAGGGLCVATLLALKDEGLPQPRAAFLLSPWLDLSLSGESIESRRDQDPWFRAADIRIVAKYYCDECQLAEPLVSPVFADVAALPPMYIQVGNDELLLSDATRLADNLGAAGVDVDVDVWPDMWHVFQAFLLVVPEARDAVAKMGARMRESLPKPP